MTDTSGDRPVRPLRSLVDTAEMLIITFFAVTLVFTYLVRVVTVNGGSMENTLMPDDRVLINLMDRSPENGDIVLVNANNSYTLAEDGSLVKGKGVGRVIIKRVIACGGQTVDINFGSGAVYVDGERLYEDYLVTGLTHNDEGAFTGKYPLEVPEGYVFVMGDHRSVSKDSRSPDVGFVPVDSIAGTAVLRLYPFDSFGAI